MASNELISLLASEPARPGAPSILDQTLREVLLRAAGPAEPYRHLRDLLFYEPAMAAIDPTRGSAGFLAAALDARVKASNELDWRRTLDHERSDIASIARFGHRVEYASYCLYIAFDRARVENFELTSARNTVKPRHGVSVWYCHLVNTTFNRYRDLKRALLHRWAPPAEVEPLTLSAFLALSEITPAESQLRNLFVHDQPRAFHELTRHLDLVADQLKAAIELASDLETVASDEASSEEQERLNAIQTELLAKAGKALSLTQAAGELAVSRQALHKRIGLGTALGLMRGSELILPDVQFVSKDGKLKIVDGLSDVIRVFDSSGAGRWAALQFLTDIDPNLGRTPIEALRSGEGGAVVHAARASLGLDEG